MLERSDYERFRTEVRRLSAEKIAPYAAAVDADSRFPQEAVEAFKEMQLAALPFAEAHGGHGADVLTQAICLEEIARVCAASSLTLMVNWAGLLVIHDNGSDRLLDETIREAVKGDLLASICLTGSHGGSDIGTPGRRRSRTAMADC